MKKRQARFSNNDENYKFIWDGKVGRIYTETHRIIMRPTYATARHLHPYRGGRKQRKVKRKKVEKIQDEMMARLAVEKQASAIVLVLKKDGSFLVSADYHCFSAVTKRESYSIPQMQKWIELLSSTEIFSVLNASSS